MIWSRINGHPPQPICSGCSIVVWRLMLAKRPDSTLETTSNTCTSRLRPMETIPLEREFLPDPRSPVISNVPPLRSAGLSETEPGEKAAGTDNCKRIGIGVMVWVYICLV